MNPFGHEAMIAAATVDHGNQLADQQRTCDTTGLPVCLTAQKFIRMNAVLAVVFLLIGAIAALGLVLTRWPAGTRSARVNDRVPTGSPGC